MSPGIYTHYELLLLQIPHIWQYIHTAVTKHHEPIFWPFTWGQSCAQKLDGEIRMKQTYCSTEVLYTCMYICIYTYCNHDSAWVGLHCYNIIMQYEHKIYTHMLHT